MAPPKPLFYQWDAVSEIWEVSSRGEVSFSGQNLIREYLDSLLSEVPWGRKSGVLFFEVLDKICFRTKRTNPGTYLILNDSQVFYGSFIIDTPTQRFLRFYPSNGGSPIWRIV